LAPEAEEAAQEMMTLDQLRLSAMAYAMVKSHKGEEMDWAEFVEEYTPRCSPKTLKDFDKRYVSGRNAVQNLAREILSGAKFGTRVADLAEGYGEVVQFMHQLEMLSFRAAARELAEENENQLAAAKADAAWLRSALNTERTKSDDLTNRLKAATADAKKASEKSAATAALANVLSDHASALTDQTSELAGTIAEVAEAAEQAADEAADHQPRSRSSNPCG
jgi:methyl-accepting chemotaxis protein